MKKLYVGNLPYETTESDLQTLFSECGAVESVAIPTDRQTGRARGFAFVEMVEEADAQTAISTLNEKEFGGRSLTVNESRPPQPRGSRGGGGGGYGGGGGGGGKYRRDEPRW